VVIYLVRAHISATSPGALDVGSTVWGPFEDRGFAEQTVIQLAGRSEVMWAEIIETLKTERDDSWRKS
jgi:hypothetical protein